MFEVRQAMLIQDLMRLGREWGPIFRVTTPTGPIHVAYGLEMSSGSRPSPSGRRRTPTYR
jgi:hypothetical protein